MAELMRGAGMNSELLPFRGGFLYGSFINYIAEIHDVVGT